MTIKFIGATESVTGSQHLVITDKGRQILLDCGLYQGMGQETDELNRKFLFDPSEIDTVVLSHAHIDHSGNLPLLVKRGFKGRIYCTEATMDVSRLLLMDSAHIHEDDIFYINKRRAEKHLPLLKPLYTRGDTEECLKHFKSIPFNTAFALNDEISIRFIENGHIPGSAAIHITANTSAGKTLCYTGDIGRYNDPLLKAPENIPQAENIICESTYGDKIHEDIGNSKGKLLQCIQKTCIENKGKLFIPAFSLGRTQQLLYLLNQMKNEGLFPHLKVYVDSPLSSGATKVIKAHPECFNSRVRDYIKQDPDPFGFEDLVYVENSSESKLLNKLNKPCIIIAASGMCDAGRIKHHLKNGIGNPLNTVLISGHCAPGTLGAKLLAGDRQVRIYGEFYEVKARVDSILSFSAHADREDIARYLSCLDTGAVKNIFLVHGEPGPKLSLRNRLTAAGFKNVIIPQKGNTVTL